MGLENIAIIADEFLLGSFTFPKSGRYVDRIDLEGVTVTILTATHPARCLLRECPYTQAGRLAQGNEQRHATRFEDAFRVYVNDICAGRPDTHQVDLVFVCSASPNEDVDLIAQMKILYEARTHGVVYIDLGGYLDAAIGGSWLQVADYLVRSTSPVLHKAHLDRLWEWIPECRRGFQMYWFEGHHPNEPTWLKPPPDPFGFRNLILARKIESWGALRKEFSEPVEG